MNHINLAYDYVESAKRHADRMDGDAPMWYGWAIREAFIAGYKAATRENGNKNVEDVK